MYPISLSYQAKTFTRFPPTTLVFKESTILANLNPKISEETNCSSVTANNFFHFSVWEAFFKIRLTSSTVVSLLATKVRSAILPATVGTRIEIPSNKLSNLGKALVKAIAAPVVEGIMF